MEPFEHEAQLALATARASVDPHADRAKKKKAAEALIEAFLKLAESQGFDRGRVIEDDCSYIAAGERSIRVMSDGGGGIYLRRPPRYGGQSKTGPTLVPLNFDYVTGEFVGQGIDTSIAPTPGQRLLRVHALVVMARLAAELLVAAEAEV